MLDVSNTQGHEKGSTTLDPEFSWIVTTFQINIEHEGVRVWSTLSSWVIVRWAWINVLRWFSTLLDWLEMKDWHWASKLHNFWLTQAQFFKIPFSTLNVKSRNESTVFWMLVDFMSFFWNWNEIKLKFIDWSTRCFSRESLKKRSGESSWISKGTNPEVIWNSLKSPNIEEFISLLQVIEPISKRFLREISEVPCNWYLVHIKGIQDRFEIWRNDNQTFDTLSELIKILGEDSKKDVVSLNFLE